MQSYKITEEQQKKAFRLAFDLFSKTKNAGRIEALNEAYKSEKEADSKLAIYLIDSINKFIFDKLESEIKDGNK